MGLGNSSVQAAGSGVGGRGVTAYSVFPYVNNIQKGIGRLSDGMAQTQHEKQEPMESTSAFQGKTAIELCMGARIPPR